MLSPGQWHHNSILPDWMPARLWNLQWQYTTNIHIDIHISLGYSYLNDFARLLRR